MSERKRSEEGVEGERQRADGVTPPHSQDYPPGTARVLDEDDELASQSDDEPSLE